MRPDSPRVEVLDAQAQVIHVAASRARRRAAHPAELAVYRDQIDQRGPATQLIQADGLLRSLQGAADDVLIEGHHGGVILRADHDVVDAEGLEPHQ